LLTTTAYFAPYSWFLTALDTGNWQWEAHENYQKGGPRNRCRIATANGPLLLSIPLTGGKHQQMPIREVRIDYRQDWQRQHAQTIRSAYGRAPYYEFYADDLLAVAAQRHNFLWDYNLALTQHLIATLGLPLTLSYTSCFRGGASDKRRDVRAGHAGADNSIRQPTPYRQVFEERYGFLPGLSILDALFCLGPSLATNPSNHPKA